jgi:hypothetical protein
MEGDSNTKLISFQTRVLLEVLDQNVFFYLSQLFYVVRLKVVGVMLGLGLHRCMHIWNVKQNSLKDLNET